MCKNCVIPRPHNNLCFIWSPHSHSDRNSASSYSLFPGLSLNSKGLKSAMESGEPDRERNPILTASSPLACTLWESPHLCANGTSSSPQHFSACSPFQALSVPLLRGSRRPTSNSLSLFSSLFPSQDPWNFYLPWAEGSATEAGPLFFQIYFLNWDLNFELQKQSQFLYCHLFYFLVSSLT